jgi:type I restriction enzyme S subunit
MTYTERSATNQQINAVIPNDGFSPDYVYYAITHRSRRLPDLAGRAAVPIVNKSNFSKFLIPLAPYDEQRGIARVLGAIQRGISAQDGVLAAAREVKRSLMARLFRYGPGAVPAETRETEIGEVPAHWEVVRLEQLIASGPQNGLYKPPSYYGDGVPILRIDAFHCGDVIQQQQLKRLRLSEKELSKYALAKGDIVVNRVNGNVEILGKSALVGELTEPTVFESNMMKFAADTERIANTYLLQFWCSAKMRDQIRRKARIVHQTSINQQDLKSLLIPLPNLAEQDEIGWSLAMLDQKIEIEERKKAALEELFKSMLEQLMTGRIRVGEMA